MRAGIVDLFVGSTGDGLWTARRRSRPVRAAAVVLSPVALAATVLVFGMLTGAAVGTRGPFYLREEIGIIVSAVIGLLAGAGLRRRGTGASERPGQRTSTQPYIRASR